MYRTTGEQSEQYRHIFIFMYLKKKKLPLIQYNNDVPGINIYTLPRRNEELQAASGRRQERRNNTTTTNFEKKEKNSRSDDK